MSLKSTRSSATARYSPYQHKDHHEDSKNESKRDPSNEQAEDEKSESSTQPPNNQETSTNPDSSKTHGEVVAPAKTPSPSVPPSSPPDTSTENSTKTTSDTTEQSTTSQSRESPTQTHMNGYQSYTSATSTNTIHSSRSPPPSALLPPVSQSRSAYSSPYTTTQISPPGPPQPLGASKVIHFRNVGASITKEDLMGIASPFGHIEQVVLLRSKNQALIQMRDLEAAINLMEFYTRNPCAVRGKRIYLGFSRHQGLAAAIPVNRIVLVTMQSDNGQSLFPYYINTDVIKQIFSTHGYVEKIVIITKPDKDLQALIQFSLPDSAVQAMHYLNTQTIYLGTDSVIPITLDLQFSNLTELTVKQNCDKSRDYSGLFQPPAYPSTYPPANAYPYMAGQIDPSAQMPPSGQGAYDYSAYYQM